MVLQECSTFVLKSSVEKCNRVVPLLVQRHRQIVVLSRRKKDERLQRACCSPGEEVESPEFSESLWSTLLFRPPSPQKTEFKANFEEIFPLARFHLIGALRSVEDEAKSLLPEQDMFIIVSFVLQFTLNI